MSAVCLALAVILTLITVQVKRLVWETDKVIPSMLIMMCCTLYSLLLFFVWVDIFAATFLV
jgi:hypothetical protein